MAEYTNNVDQVVQPGGVVIFNVVVEGCRKGFIRHRNGTGSFLLSGANCCRCNPKYSVKFGANIGVPTGETVGPVSLALAIDGSADNSTIMTVTPAAAEELFNVSRCSDIDIWSGCCETIAVQNVGTIPVTVNAPTISIKRG
jgi:hypothetical protein